MVDLALKDAILQAVTEKYLTSLDFNGLPVPNLVQKLSLDESTATQALIALIEENRAALNFDSLNPHIKRHEFLPPKVQLERLPETELAHLVIYPSKTFLKQTVDPNSYEGRPFTLRLALGEPQLHYLSFDLRVLEFYRNDPRYRYTTNDISGKIGATESLAGRDNVLLESFGFSYDDDHNRAVAVFLRYLSGLSPEHQQTWNANTLGDEYKLHPAYYGASILGEWHKGVTIFAAFVEELHCINEICQLMGQPPLFRQEFRAEERPQGFGFLIRPTLREFNDFVLLLDKMMSENLNKEFFRGDIELEAEETRKDGKVVVTQKGTIKLLEEWLKLKFKARDQETAQAVEDMIKSFRLIRNLRQKPAHAINENEFNQEFFHRQRQLMIDAYVALMDLRKIFHLHPQAQAYKIPDWLESSEIWTE